MTAEVAAKQGLKPAPMRHQVVEHSETSVARLNGVEPWKFCFNEATRACTHTNKEAALRPPIVDDHGNTDLVRTYLRQQEAENFRQRLTGRSILRNRTGNLMTVNVGSEHAECSQVPGPVNVLHISPPQEQCGSPPMHRLFGMAAGHAASGQHYGRDQGHDEAMVLSGRHWTSHNLVTLQMQRWQDPSQSMDRPAAELIVRQTHAVLIVQGLMVHRPCWEPTVAQAVPLRQRAARGAWLKSSYGQASG